MEPIDNTDNRVLFNVVTCYLQLSGADAAFFNDISMFIDGSSVGFVYTGGKGCFPAVHAKNILSYASANDIYAVITVIEEYIVILFENNYQPF